MMLMSRISRIFRADLHAVLDRIEEPEGLLRQAIREMEELIADDEQRSRLLSNEQRQLGSRQDKVKEDLRKIEEELDVCFQFNEEALARKLIRRRLETQQFCSFLKDRRNTLAESSRELRTRLEEHQAHLDSMRQKAELFSTEEPVELPDENWSAPNYRVADADVEVAFLGEKKKRTRS